MASALVRVPLRWRRKRSLPRFWNSSPTGKVCRIVLAATAAVSACAVAVAALAAGPATSDVQPQLHAILVGDLKFSAEEMADLERGKIVKHALPATAAAEVAAVGGV